MTTKIDPKTSRQRRFGIANGRAHEPYVNLNTGFGFESHASGASSTLEGVDSQQALSQTRLPFVIALVPPATIPAAASANTPEKSVIIPSPSDVRLQLITTRTSSTSGPVNIESFRAPSTIVVPARVFLGVQDPVPPVQIPWSLRTPDGALASGSLPLNFEILGDGEGLLVDPIRGLVQGSLPSIDKSTTVRVTAWIFDGTRLEATTVLSSNPDLVYDALPLPLSLPSIGANDPQQTSGNGIIVQTTTANDIGTDFQKTLRSRFLAFRGASPKVSRDLSNRLTQDAYARSRASRPDVPSVVIDTTLLSSESIQEQRVSNAPDLKIAQQAQAIMDLEPLAFYINPDSMSLTWTPIISDSNRGARDYIVEHWGSDLSELSVSGSMGGFITSSRDGTRGGYAPANQQHSEAWRRFMSLYKIYKNSGYLYNQDRRIETVGSTEIYFRDTIYTGIITSLNFKFEADRPHTGTYDLAFLIYRTERLA